MNEKSKCDDIKRIAISGPLFSALEKEVSVIKQKGPHYKVNESKLATAIIGRFLEHYLEKDRKWIEGQFFDRKTYLKGLIDKATSEDDLSSSVKEYLQFTKWNRAKKPLDTEPEL